MMVDDKSCTRQASGEILKFTVCCFVYEPKFVEEFIRKKYVLQFFSLTKYSPINLREEGFALTLRFGIFLLWSLGPVVAQYVI